MRIEYSPMIGRLVESGGKGAEHLARLLCAMAKNEEKSHFVVSTLKKLTPLFPGFVSNVWSKLYYSVTVDAHECDAVVVANAALHFGRFHHRRLDVLRNFISDLEDCAFNEEEAREFLVDELGLVYCEHCDEMEFGDEARGNTYEGLEYVCRECIEDSFTYSHYYDQYLLSDNSTTALDADGDRVTVHEDDDNFSYSDDAGMRVHHDYEPPEPEVIQSYHSSKRNQRVQPDDWTSLNKRYLGVELEVEVASGDRHTAAERINDVVNDGEVGRKVFFEADGSLNNGFEVISQPMSLPAQTQLWQWLKEKSLIRGLKSHNTTTCGLHVHVSKQNLTSLQIAKIVTFVNSPVNEDFIKALARRYGQAGTGYCRIKDKSKIGSAHQSQDRYEAVNVTNRHTIEFRIFKGSLKYESVISAIEFANAMIEFTKPYSGYGCRDLTAECFMDFISKKMPSETKTLREYINNRLEIA